MHDDEPAAGTPAGPARSAAGLIRDRTVALLLGSELLSSMAAGALATALGWQAYGRSHHPIVLGLIGLAEFLPAVVLALPAGHAADRHDRRYVGGFGLALGAIVALALAADAAAGDRGIWPLYGLAFAAGVSQAFIAPAFNPLLAAAVPSVELSRVIAMSSSTWQGATILGPALGGLLQRMGNPAPYLAVALFYGAATLFVLPLPRAVGVAHVASDATRATFADALDGLRLIASSPALLGAISLDLAAVLFGGATALLPIFARDILHVGAVGNGVLRAAPGVGAVLVGIVLATRPVRRRVGRALFAAVGTYGVFTIVFGLSRSFVLSLVALSLLAAADMVSVFIRGTLGPLLTPPALRGRVGAVERVFIGGSNELGAFESGVAASLLGAVGAVVLGGVLSIAIAALWAWRFPALRQVDAFEDIPPATLAVAD